jgi:multidrug transporter EmrE-like cation transporter
VNITTQSAAAIFRQFLAILGIIFGILTQSVKALHLSPVVSAWLGIGGVVILAIEHYVGDPSTGTATTTQPPTVTAVLPAPHDPKATP